MTEQGPLWRNLSPLRLDLFIAAVSYRLPDLVEYIVEPLLTGLGDKSSYVRRCAVMGCVKLYHLIPDFVEGM